MNLRQIFWNAISTFGQVVAGAAILFVLYRFLVHTLGIRAFGIWSLVLAGTSFATLASQGFSASLTRLIANRAAWSDQERISTVLQTAVLAAATALGLAIVLLYPAARWTLHLLIRGTDFAAALSILPFALLSLWISLLAMLLQAGLAGLQLIAHANLIDLAGSLFYLAACFALVPHHRLVGLAIAQVLQGLFIGAACWILLRRRVDHLPLIPQQLDRSALRELARLGLQFQAITLAQSVREPVTKALLARFGGLSYAGYYDLASRGVVTARELLVQANQVLIPAVAHIEQREPRKIAALYLDSYRVLFFLALPAFALIAVASPLLSLFWLGRVEPTFIVFVALLAAGWMVNVLCNPSYVIALGTGHLRPVLLGCCLTATLNASFGFIAGRYASPAYIVAASAFSLAAGYVIILVSCHRRWRTRLSELLPESSAPAVCIFWIGSLIVIGFVRASVATAASPLSLHALFEVTAIFYAAAAVTLWRHPLRKRLQRWAFSRMHTGVQAT